MRTGRKRIQDNSGYQFLVNAKRWILQEVQSGQGNKRSDSVQVCRNPPLLNKKYSARRNFVQYLLQGVLIRICSVASLNRASFHLVPESHSGFITLPHFRLIGLELMGFEYENRRYLLFLALWVRVTMGHKLRRARSSSKCEPGWALICTCKYLLGMRVKSACKEGYKPQRVIDLTVPVFTRGCWPRIPVPVVKRNENELSSTRPWRGMLCGPGMNKAFFPGAENRILTVGGRCRAYFPA